MKKLVKYLICCLIIALTTCVVILVCNNNHYQKKIEALEDVGNGIEKHGNLSVYNVDLVDEHGETIKLSGVSSHGLSWYPEYINYSSLKTIREMGANAFRIAMYTEHSKGYINTKDESFKQMRLAIENVIAADMYAIVDWHTLKDENPNLYVKEAMDFFERISSLYANNPGIIYEICNEPNGDTTWQDVVDYANKVIPVIRKNSPNAVIIVGTPKHCTDLKSVENNKLAFSNVMYSFHYYTDLGKDNYIKIISRALKNNIPIFVSEWGINKGEGQLELGENFVKYLNKNNISWTAWSLSNKDEAYSFIKSTCDNLSNWSEDCITKNGKIVFDNFK